MDREHTESCQKGVGGVLGEKGEGINQTNEKIPCRHRQQCVITRGEEGLVEEGKWGINDDGRRLDVRWRTHNTIYR